MTSTDPHFPLRVSTPARISPKGGADSVGGRGADAPLLLYIRSYKRGMKVAKELAFEISFCRHNCLSGA